MTDTDRFKAGPFSHEGGGLHVFPASDGSRATVAGIYTRDDRGAVRERGRVMPSGEWGIGTDQPEFLLDVNGLARFRPWLADDLPDGKIGCVTVAVDHRYGPGTGCLVFHNGSGWEEVGRVSLAGAPMVGEPVVSRAEFDALKAAFDQLAQAHAELRHAFENHGHAHDQLMEIETDAE